MVDGKQALFARNLISVCVDSTENSDYQGKIWHQYSDAPLDFKSCLEMLQLMEELLDEWDFPQKAVTERSFVKDKKATYEKSSGSEELIIDQIQKAHGVRDIQNKKGKIATFVVQVAFRQSATWQGHVICDKADVMMDFNSALELLRIMDKYIEI